MTPGLPIKNLQNALRDGGEIKLDDESCCDMASEADGLAKWLARNLDQREKIALELSGRGDAIINLANIWKPLAESFKPNAAKSSSALEENRLFLATSLAKLERNLIAGISDLQQQAVTHEPLVRELIFNITTFVRIEDPRFFELQAIVTQLLSNMISPVSPDGRSSVSDEKLALYLDGQREHDVVIRLLDSQDVRTNMATLRLIDNMTKNSAPRQRLCLSPTGARWFGRVLSNIEGWHEKGDEDGRFDLAVGIFNSFIGSGLAGHLLDLISDDTEPVTPSQTIFLKLVDSHLASSSRPNPAPSPNLFLVKRFKDYARYSSISLGSGQDDARLPKVFEALVLVCEGLSSISLAAQARKDKGKGRADEPERGGDEDFVAALKREDGVVKPAVDLLRRLDHLIPRVKPGTTPTHRLSPEQAAPVALLKRLLVQLLGILTFEDTATGDLVREAGGVELILGLTEVDESNPYLREHALLAVRNLMWNNPANQDVVRQMDPVGVVSETGEVLPLPEKMRRKRAQESDETTA